MKKAKMLNNAELASFCGELALLLPAGITPYDAILCMQEDSSSPQALELLNAIASSLQNGMTFCEALSSTEVFPEYVVSMILLGEQSGNLDIIMRKLASYYKQQCEISDSIRSAVSYPLIMIALMLLILIVLLTKVLPVFQQVFIQLGSDLSSVSRQLMSMGTVIRNVAVIFTVLIVFITVTAFILSFNPALKHRMVNFLHSFRLTHSFYTGIAYSRFASALAIVSAGGIDVYTGLALASKLAGNEQMNEKIAQCKEYLLQGDDLPQAMKKATIFQSRDIRVLQLGYRSGNADSVYEQISSHYEDDTISRLQKMIGSIEPTLVIIFSLMVGMILLSVIMPLIGIMSSIG